MNNKVVTIVFVSVCLLLLVSVGGSFLDDSFDLFLHGSPVSKFPETLFVFWLGMSQAGVLLSVFLLIMNVKIHRRTSLLLELSSLCGLLVSGAFALFYSEQITLNVNFYGIGIVGFISLLFFTTHLATADSTESLALCNEMLKIRRPLAWIILPTMFWVDSILCLDFASSHNLIWQGALFPLYVVSGIFYLGLALLVVLLSFENYYNRRTEKFLMLCSWFISVLFFWVLLVKGEGCISSFVFACVVPQFLFVKAVRENLWSRLMVALCILFGFLLKCDFVVCHRESRLILDFKFADASLLFVGVALFVAAFFGVRMLLSRFFENDEILMGEVNANADDEEIEEKKDVYYSPFSAPEFKVVRLPVLCGILVGVAYGYFTSDWAGLVEPVAAYVSCVLVCLQPFVHLGFSKKYREGKNK